ncbi:MAG: type II toxin-antitoxin system prevent-host-death family antitoxin [Actinobacteria bacterium]|nr:type II toxin-antitoxin system prevent-host-death family antitoxin [Actinomycetota bacterium]
MTTHMRKVGIRELRQDASSVLKDVKAGATIEITEHGHPIAHIIPIQRSGWEELVAAGLVIPAAEPWSAPTRRIKMNGAKTSTQLLMEMREGER